MPRAKPGRARGQRITPTPPTTGGGQSRQHDRGGSLRPKPWLAALAVAASLVGQPGAASAWTPPIGVPTPAWPADLDIARPALPSPWSAEQAGYYYVDPSSCSDSRTYGRPGAPRCSMPSSPAAGSVIVLNGTISGTIGVTYRGSAGSPIWIMGYSQTSRPTLTGEWGFGGSYTIVDSLVWSYNARDGIALEGDHLMLRNCALANPYDAANGAGFGIGGSNIIFYKNTISQMGNWQYTGSSDIDRHGIKVYPPAADVWIVDSLFYHIHGDAVQVGDQNNTASQINRIYIGKNTTYENFQSGFWVKNATDVIFSQNVVHNLTTASGFSPGIGLGGQYDPKYVWFIANRIYSSNTGIHVAGASAGGGGPWYMLGNVIYGIQSPYCSAYDGGALGFRNSGTVGMFFNTVYDVDTFVALAPGGSSVTIRDNIFASKRAACSAFENAGASFTHDYNLYSSSSYDPNSESHRVVGNPLFIGAASGNFGLQATSPAIDRASPTEESVYALFQSRYGVNIRKDFTGLTRPQGAAWDIGAYEGAGGGSTNGAPAAPTYVRIVK